MADYLETYARTFELDVRTASAVDSLMWDGERFVLMTADRRYEAENVVVATGAEQIPKARRSPTSSIPRSCSSTPATTGGPRSSARASCSSVRATPAPTSRWTVDPGSHVAVRP